MGGRGCTFMHAGAPVSNYWRSRRQVNSCEKEVRGARVAAATAPTTTRAVGPPSDLHTQLLDFPHAPRDTHVFHPCVRWWSMYST